MGRTAPRLARSGMPPPDPLTDYHGGPLLLRRADDRGSWWWQVDHDWAAGVACRNAASIWYGIHVA